MLQLLVALVLFLLAFWAVSAIPMDPTVRRIVQVLEVVLLVLWLLSSFGLLPAAPRGRW